MSDCKRCRFAEWDYEIFHNSPDKQWFIYGCQKALNYLENENCEGYEDLSGGGVDGSTD